MDTKTPVYAAIDIGTNSIRLAVVRAEGGLQFTTLALHREVVRLGEGEFETNQMTPEAIARGALVCVKFAEVARGFGAQEIVAFATSAVREAENRDEFIRRVQEEAGMEVRVISGMEEARLIWLGVSSGIDLGARKAVLIDIGGGSTEVIVGSARNANRNGGNADGSLSAAEADNYEVLESMKLGSIRMSNHFPTGDSPVSPESYARMQDHVRAISAQVARKVRSANFDLAMGSAGTIGALAEVVARFSPDTTTVSGRNITFRLSDLRDAGTHVMPSAVGSAAQCARHGYQPRRHYHRGRCRAANRNGSVWRGTADNERTRPAGRILLDHLLRGDEARQHFQSLSVRRRSILQLARACNYDAEHAEHTSYLCLRLFDELANLGAHHYGDAERELLNYAAIVHDIGTFLSHSNHQKHAYYLVRNSDLLGFDNTEINIIANVALYHRKGLPKKKHPNMAEFTPHERHVVGALAAILCIAEGMDRSHLNLVQDIHLERAHNPEQYVLTPELRFRLPTGNMGHTEQPRFV